MKRYIIPLIIALLVTLGLLLFPGNIVSVQGGYAYGASENTTAFTLNFKTGAVFANGVEYIPKIRDFANIKELEAFLEVDNTDRRVILVASKDGMIKFNGQCEDRAFQLRDSAAALGYRMETEALERHEYYKWYRVWMKKNRFHMICKTFIGNDVWYIEPSNDKHWIGLRLD